MNNLIDQSEVRVVQPDFQVAIERNLRELARIKKDKKNLKESLENILENETDYIQFQNDILNAQRAMKNQKLKLMQKPEVLQLKVKEDDLKEEEKEIKESLSALLDVYTTKTGNAEFETTEGQIIKIKRRFSVDTRQLKLF